MKDKVGCGEGKGEPRIERDHEKPLVSPRDDSRVHHQINSLNPAFPLLKKVPHGERRCFPHFSFDKVKCEAVRDGLHSKEAILRDGAIWTVVEGNRPFSASLHLNHTLITIRQFNNYRAYYFDKRTICTYA